MKVIDLKCPNCGNQIDFKNGSKKAKCEYCKSSVILDDEVVKLEIVNNTELKGLIKIADTNYENRYFKEAREDYRKALLIDSDNCKILFRYNICDSLIKKDYGILTKSFEEVYNKDEDEYCKEDCVIDFINIIVYIGKDVSKWNTVCLLGDKLISKINDKELKIEILKGLISILDNDEESYSIIRPEIEEKRKSYESILSELDPNYEISEDSKIEAFLRKIFGTNWGERVVAIIVYVIILLIIIMFMINE